MEFYGCPLGLLRLSFCDLEPAQRGTDSTVGTSFRFFFLAILLIVGFWYPFSSVACVFKKQRFIGKRIKNQ